MFKMSEWNFLWGLEGRELIDAMSSGGTYDDWAYIEKMERQQGFEDDDYDEFSKKNNTKSFTGIDNKDI